jgi:hypothetical protein
MKDIASQSAPSTNLIDYTSHSTPELSSTAASLMDEWDTSVSLPENLSSTSEGRRLRNRGNRSRIQAQSSSSVSSNIPSKFHNNSQIRHSSQRIVGRLTEEKKELVNLIDDYRSIWYPNMTRKTHNNKEIPSHRTRSRHSSNSNDDELHAIVSSDFVSALEFEHPPSSLLSAHDSQSSSSSSPDTISSSWRKVVDSEQLFRRICVLSHELFVSSASLSEKLDRSLSASADFNMTTSYASYSLPSSNKISQEEFFGDDFVMVSILPFWEKLRQERGAIVNTYRPEVLEVSATTQQSKDDATSSDQTLTGTTTMKSWAGGLVESFLGAIGLGKLSSGHSLIDIPVTAHRDPDCAPNHYHYAKLMRNLYFNYWPLVVHLRQKNAMQISAISEDNAPDDSLGGEDTARSDERNSNGTGKKLIGILNQRAKRLQEVVDHCPSNDILNSKDISLLLRSYQDVGTLEASNMAERMYNRFPDQRATGNLWYVLMSYTKIINDDIEKKKKELMREDNNWVVTLGSDQPTEAMVIAAGRICDILSSAHSKNPRDFQSYAYLGFQALASISPMSMDGYYDRVHSLGILKFGPTTWDALVNEDSNTQVDWYDSLHPNEFRTLHSLVNIYTKDYEHIDRAIRLLEIAFDTYTVDELKESFRRASFAFMLNKLKKRKHVRLKAENNDKPVWNSRANPDLDAGLRIVDKMRLHESWFPTSSTFRCLFSLCDGGADADRVLAALEVIRGIADVSGTKDGSAVKHDEVLDSASVMDEIFPPMKAARFALNEWAETASRMASMNDYERGGVDPAVRAWEILRSIQVMGATPLFMPADQLSHVYYRDCDLDASIFTLVLKVCSRSTSYSKEAVNVTLRVMEIVERECVLMVGSTCVTLLNCISNFPDINERVLLTKEVIRSAMARNPELQPEIVAYLEQQFSYYQHKHPQLYDKHLRDLGFENTILKKRTPDDARVRTKPKCPFCGKLGHKTKRSKACDYHHEWVVEVGGDESIGVKM